MDLDKIDILDPNIYLESGVPHEQFAILRKEAPVFWHKEPEGRGFWAITRYHDLIRVLRDPELFSSQRGGIHIPDYPPEDPRASPSVLAVMDPPKHTRYRALLAKAFLPRIIEALEPRIRAIMTQMIDKVAPQGECDFVQDLAGSLPLLVLLELVGVPLCDRDKIVNWSIRYFASEDPDFKLSQEESQQIAIQMVTYAHELAAERRKSPRGEDDLLSLLMAAEIEGEKLSYDDFGLFFALLLAAGHDTTRALIANGMLALFEHPEQYRRLSSDHSLVPSAVEEMLRYTCPLNHFRRTATRETEIHGKKIAEGDKVVVFHASANRDEEVFPNPSDFDIGRTPNEHITLGYGPHFCLGAPLARLEAKVAFEEILRRLPDLSLAGGPVRIRSNFLNGLKAMPVSFTPTS